MQCDCAGTFGATPAQDRQWFAGRDKGLGKQNTVRVLGDRNNVRCAGMRGAYHSVSGFAVHTAVQHFFCTWFIEDPRTAPRIAQPVPQHKIMIASFRSQSCVDRCFLSVGAFHLPHPQKYELFRLSANTTTTSAAAKGGRESIATSAALTSSALRGTCRANRRGEPLPDLAKPPFSGTRKHVERCPGAYAP